MAAAKRQSAETSPQAPPPGSTKAGYFSGLMGQLHRGLGHLDLLRARLQQTPYAKTFGSEALLSAIVVNLGTVFTAMYATRLGASDTQIGLLSSGPQFFAMLMLIPGALLAGRAKDCRAPVEWATLCTGLFYGLAALSPALGDLRIGFLILMASAANAALNLYFSSWQHYFSEAIPFDARHQVYTLRTSMTFLAGTLVTLLTGAVLGAASSPALRIRLYQGTYVLAFAFSLLQWRMLRQSPTATSESASTGLRELWQALKALLGRPGFRRFALVSLLFHAGWYMAWPLFFLNQVHYCGADEHWIAYIAVTGTLFQMLTVGTWGRFIQRYGSHLAMSIGMLGLFSNPLIASFSSYLPVPFKLPSLLLLNLISAGTFSGFQLAFLPLLLAEMPSTRRNLSLALFNTTLLACNSGMQMLGIGLYKSLGQNHGAMSVSLLSAGSLRLLGTLIFLGLFWKEIQKAKRPKPKA